MKKKLIAIAIAGVIAAPLAQAATTLSGDAEFKMKTTQAAGWTGYNRVRVKVDADLGGGVGVHTRLRLTTGQDNEAAFTTATTDAGLLGTATGLDADGEDATNTASSTNTARVDYAYLTAKVGGASLTLGDQMADWGTKYFVEGALKNNRLKAMFAPTSQLTLGLIMDPIEASDGRGAPLLSALGVIKLSNMVDAGLIYTQAYTDSAGVDQQDANNVYIKGQMGGGVVFGLESSSAEIDSDRGIYVMGGMNAGDVALEAHYAKAASQDGDWSPLGAINGISDVAGGEDATVVITAAIKAGGWDIKAGAGQAGAVVASAGVSTDKETLFGIDMGTKMGAANFNVSYGSHTDANSKENVNAFGFKFDTKF